MDGNEMDMREKLQEVEMERKKIRSVATLEDIERQHAKGKLTARERVEIFFDPKTFRETHAWAKPRPTGFEIDKRNLWGDGVITGFGMVNHRPVYAYAQDFTVAGGTVATVHAGKVIRLMKQALKMGVPCVHLVDSGGVRFQDAVTRDHNEAYTAFFYYQTIASGVIPQISLLMGPAVAGAAYSPILNDFVFMVKGTSHFYISSPTVIKAVMFKEVTEEELGGAMVHAQVSGCCDLVAENDEDCLKKARELLGFLPPNNKEAPPVVSMGDDPNRRDEDLLNIVSLDPKRPFDMHKVIDRIVDCGVFFELKADYAKNMITGFARLDGRTVGIVANNSMHLGGCIDINAADKEARFVRFCDCFNIPLVFLVDTAAYLPGPEQEHGGIIRHGAKILHAISEATVPKITVYVKRAKGGGVSAMCNQPLGSDLLLAWPSAEVGSLTPEGVVNVLYRKEIAKAKDPEAVKKRRMEEYAASYGRAPYHAAEMRWVEEIIDPRDTRPLLIEALKIFSMKKEERPWKKHGNIPL